MLINHTNSWDNLGCMHYLLYYLFLVSFNCMLILGVVWSLDFRVAIVVRFGMLSALKRMLS
jgi:hypothetical protein